MDRLDRSGKKVGEITKSISDSFLFSSVFVSSTNTGKIWNVDGGPSIDAGRPRLKKFSAPSQRPNDWMQAVVDQGIDIEASKLFSKRFGITSDEFSIAQDCGDADVENEFKQMINVFKNLQPIKNELLTCRNEVEQIEIAIAEISKAILDGTTDREKGQKQIASKRNAIREKKERIYFLEPHHDQLEKKLEESCEEFRALLFVYMQRQAIEKIEENKGEKKIDNNATQLQQDARRAEDRVEKNRQRWEKDERKAARTKQEERARRLTAKAAKIRNNEVRELQSREHRNTRKLEEKRKQRTLRDRRVENRRRAGLPRYHANSR